MTNTSSLSQYTPASEQGDNNETTLLCKVYRCERKAHTYLYVSFTDDVALVPEALLTQLGELFEVISLELTPSRKLANANVEKVISEIKQNGFYLQLPPQDQNAELVDTQSKS